MTDPWGTVSVVSLSATTALAGYVLLRAPRSVSSTPFALLMLAFALTDLGEALARLSPRTDLQALLPWVRVQWVGIGLTSGPLLHFGLNFSRGRPLGKQAWQVPFVYAVTIGITPLVVATDWIVNGVAMGPLGPSATLGPAYPYGAMWYEAWFVLILVALVRAYVRGGPGEFRNRSRPIIFVLGGAVGLASLTEVFWPLYTPSPTIYGLGSIYILMVAVVAAYAEVKLRFLEIEAVTERVPTARRHGLHPGVSYLFLSRERDPAFTAFREMVAGTPGLCVTGLYPSKVQERYGLELTPILWITTLSEGERCVAPKGLEFELLQSVVRFVKGNPSTVVLLDDIDLLIHTNGFPAVVRFLRKLNNLAAAAGSTVVGATDREALTDEQLTVLRGLFDEAREVAPTVSFLEPLLPTERGAFLLEGDADAALSIYESIARDGEGVIVTTKNPVRVRRHVSVGSHVVWIGSAGEAVEGGRGPAAIDLEAGKIALSRLREAGRPTLYLSDIEQLLHLAPFVVVLDFVKGLIDHVASRRGVLIASVAPKAVAPAQLASLRRRFDLVRAIG